MPTDEPLDLIACIALAQEEFGSLPKDGHATIRSDKGTYEYDYITEGALMARVREILSPLGVAVLPSVTDVEHRPGGSVWITVAVMFAKGAERETVTGRAEGVDPRDKAYNKAITTAVRLVLTKTFLQGGDVDPEQTVNERTATPAGPAKLTESQIKRLTRKAIDSHIITPDGALDPKLLCRIASFVAGTQVKRVDEIPASTFLKLVDGVNGKPPALDGYAANPELGLQRVVEKEIDNGW